MRQTTVFTCACGQSAFELSGSPMLAAECWCESCRAAARTLEALPDALPMAEQGGGTRFVLYRKDRVTPLRGTDRLREYRLGPEAKTRRVVATCCNSAMFLEFQGGHWLSLYSQRLPAEQRPVPDLRTMMSDAPAGVRPDDTIPSYERQSAGFMFRLLGAWIAMGFRAPKLDYVKGALDARA